MLQLDISDEDLVSLSSSSLQRLWHDLDATFDKCFGLLASTPSGFSRGDVFAIAKRVRVEAEKRSGVSLAGVLLNALDDDIRVIKRVVPYKSGPTDTDPWDGPAEIRDADVEQLRFMSTWHDEENPDVKSSYKLPHHRQDGTISWRGLTAAMGALLGARGGVDIPDDERGDVYAHLARHYVDDFDKDPPELVAQSEEPGTVQKSHSMSEVIEIDGRLWLPVDRVAFIKLDCPADSDKPGE